jgi:hypothetical protein
MSAPEQYSSPAELRHRFNEGRYFERLLAGELHATIQVVGPAPKRFRIGMESQMITYRDESGRTVAIVHQYGERDGTPAKGTRPDPKFLFENGVRYKLSRL